MTTTAQQLSGFESGLVDFASFASATGHEICRFVIALSIIATLAACGGTSSTAVAVPAPTPSSMTVAEAKSALQAAGSGVRKLSYHAKGTITGGAGPSSFEGDLGQGTVDVTVNRAVGGVYRHIAAGRQSVFSSDGGATWKPDVEKSSAVISMMINGPLEVLPKVVGDPELESKLEVVANEMIDGVETTHVRVNHVSDPINYWIASDATVGPWIKRLTATISATDGDFHVDVAYSKLNEPVNITVPR